MKYLGVICLYSPAGANGDYTDIYETYGEAKTEDNGFGVITGFAVYEWLSHSMPDEAKDWHNTFEEAHAELLRLFEQ